MAQFTETLQSMQNRVCKQRIGLDRTLAVDFLNERLRQILDRKPDWSSLLKRNLLSIPQAYSIGTIAVTTGSTLVAGTGTNWPVDDAVNTHIQEPLRAARTVWVTPDSTVGITPSSLLYVDSAGPYPETVAVLDMMAGRILCAFQFPHEANFTATASSLVNLQLRVNSINPIFTVQAVTSPTSLYLDNPWGQVGAAGMAYQILLAYTPFAGDVKELVVVVDNFQQIALRLQVSQEELNLYDPNRTATDSPNCIANLGPNLNGQQMYEIYPPPSIPYQLSYLYHARWKGMRLPDDTPPAGINPNALIYGALADAFATPCPRPPDMKDAFFSLETANMYQSRFEQAVFELMTSEESTYQKAFTWNFAQTWGGMGMGANWEQSHSWEAAAGDY